MEILIFQQQSLNDYVDDNENLDLISTLFTSKKLTEHVNDLD